MIYNSCEVEGNQATVTLTLQMMAVSGLTKLCELQIIDTDNHTLKVTLPPLRIVKSSSVGAVESTDEFSRLAEVSNEAKQRHRGSPSEAADKANEAAQSANTAAQAANTAAQSANTAADAATSAAESANSQAKAAPDAGGLCENSRRLR